MPVLHSCVSCITNVCNIIMNPLHWRIFNPPLSPNPMSNCQKMPKIIHSVHTLSFHHFQAIKLAQSGQPTQEDETTQGEEMEVDELGEAKQSEDTGNAEEEEETSAEFEDGCISTDEDLDALIPTDSSTQESTVTETKTPLRTYKLKWLMLKGSVLALGVAMLVAGGVGSVFHPYVPPEEYLNCTDLVGDNDFYNHSIY